MLRKLAPYLLFAALGVAMLAGAMYAPAGITKFYGAIAPKPAKRDTLKLAPITFALASQGDTAAVRLVNQVAVYNAKVKTYNATLENANGAEIAAGQQASGWVPSATVGSKFIVFAGMYLLIVLLTWVAQHLTHPMPTRWAKRRYSVLFLTLSPEEQFAVYGRLQLVIVIRAAAAAVFAALVV